MGILLAFGPFFAYVVDVRVADVKAALIAATITSAALLLRDALSPKRTIKILEIGTLLLFGGLAAYAFVSGAAWSIPAVRLRVDAGLLLIVLASLALRRPFTLQYAREGVSPELWSTPEFLRTNDILTAVWGAAFAVMVAADLILLKLPTLPTRFAIILTILAIWGAWRFTAWYPERGQTKPAVSGS